MRRWMTILILMLLFPVCALAVMEGVVESAPPVAIPVPQMTDALFGAWEQGLSDIRSAAYSAAMDWAGYPADMKLEFLKMNNFPADDDLNNDEIMVRFRFHDEAQREKRLLVRYLRGTGELVWLSETMTNIQRQSGEPLEETVLMHIAMDLLAQRYGEKQIELKEILEQTDAENWIARFAVERGMYEIVLNRKSGDAVRVSLEVYQ